MVSLNKVKACICITFDEAKFRPKHHVSCDSYSEASHHNKTAKLLFQGSQDMATKGATMGGFWPEYTPLQQAQSGAL